MQKKALGKGIGALIPERMEAAKEEKVFYIGVGEIRQNPWQPRETFDQKRLDELISSIREKGVLQPVLVRHKEGSLVNSKPQDCQQHQDGASHCVEKEFYGSVDPTRTTPYSDQEIHRYQCEFPKDIEQE